MQSGRLQPGLERSERRVVSAASEAWYAAEAFWLLRTTKRRLKARGLQFVIDEALKSKATLRSGTEEAFARLGKSIADSVIRIHPGLNRCLERSLFTWSFLIRHGVRAEFIIAVRKYPFASHAWVEFRGIPLTPLPRFARSPYRVILRVPTSWQASASRAGLRAS